MDPTKKMYEGLFKRKGLFNGFYGLMDMSKERLQQVRTRVPEAVMIAFTLLSDK